MWENISTDYKIHYEQLASEDRVRYEKECMDFELPDIKSDPDDLPILQESTKNHVKRPKNYFLIFKDKKI